MSPSNKLYMLLLILFVATGALVAILFSDNPHASEGITKPMVAEAHGPQERELRILFVGNSYTYYNAMPEMMVRIAKSDPTNRTRFVVQAVTHGGTGLDDLWNAGQALALIQQQKWDYVVLQDNSLLPALPGALAQRSIYAEQFNDKIKRAGAQTILFTTWARQPGSGWYTNTEFASVLMNAANMQFKINSYMYMLAEKLKAAAVPVGVYWERALSQNPRLPLYMEDGSHPDIAGSYLAALVFYRHFSGHMPAQTTYTPSRITAEDGKLLRSIASQ